MNESCQRTSNGRGEEHGLLLELGFGYRQVQLAVLDLLLEVLEGFALFNDSSPPPSVGPGRRVGESGLFQVPAVHSTLIDVGQIWQTVD